MTEKLLDFLLVEFKDARLALKKEQEKTAESKGNYIALVNNTLLISELQSRSNKIHSLLAISNNRIVDFNSEIKELERSLQRDTYSLENNIDYHETINYLICIERKKAEIALLKQIMTLQEDN